MHPALIAGSILGTMVTVYKAVKDATKEIKAQEDLARGQAALAEAQAAQAQGQAPQAPPPPAPPLAPSPVSPLQTGVGAQPASAPRTPPRVLANQVARNVKDKKYRYDRDLLRQFQASVHVAPSGVYDGIARGALLAFGVPEEVLPLPFFGNKQTVSYLEGVNEFAQRAATVATRLPRRSRPAAPTPVSAPTVSAAPAPAPVAPPVAPVSASAVASSAAPIAVPVEPTTPATPASIPTSNAETQMPG